MNKYKRSIFIALLVAFSSSVNAATSESLQRTESALNLIQNFANEMCERVPLKGSQQNWQLTGEMRVKLKGVVKAAVDAGFSGAAKYSDGNYNGLLQQDLLAAQQNLNDCRKHYFDDLKDKLFRLGSVSSNTSTIESADVSLTIDDFGFDDKSKTLQLRGVFNNKLPNPVTITAVKFLARHDEQAGKTVIAEPQWIPLSLPPHAATTYSFAIHLSDRDANDFAQQTNLPKQIFVELRAVDSSGNASATTKHFMTLNYSQSSHYVLGTLFAMPLAILKNTTPIYTPGKKVFVLVKGLMPAMD